MKIENPRKVLAGLGALLVIAFIGQYVVVNSLENLDGKDKESKPVEKTITKDFDKWNESWKIASEATSEEDLAKAEEVLSLSLKEAERSGSKDSRLAAVLNCLAQVYEKQHRYAEAEALYTRVLAIDEKVLGKEHSAIINDLDNLAVTMMKQKKYKEAEALFQRAVALNEKIYGKEHPRTANDLSYLVLVYDIQGDTKKAREHASRALAINKKALGANHPVVASNLYSLALISSRDGNHDEAEKLLVEAQDIWRNRTALDDPKLAASLSNSSTLRTVFESQFIEAKPDQSVMFPQEAFDQAKYLRKERKFSAAEALLKNHLAEARKSSAGKPELGKYLVRLNNVLFDQAKDGEAIVFGEIACKIFDRQPEEVKKELVNWNAAAHSYLAMSYDRRNHLSLAEKHYARAIDYADQTDSVSESWKKLLKKGQATCKARIEMEKERVLASNSNS